MPGWWEETTGRGASGTTSDAIVYTRSDDLFPRSYVVVPTSAGTDSPWSWGMVSGGRFEWRGEELARRDAVIERAAAERGVERSDVAPQPWVDGVGWDVGFPAATLGAVLVALGVLFYRRPTSGTRWYWFWLVVGVPGGLGWLAYAWRELLVPRSRVRREGGAVGFLTMLVGSFVLGLLALFLGNATGMTVIPR